MASDKKITELTAYTAIQDVDVMPIVDIGTTTTKKSTWANIKSVLQTYFATVFAGITTSQTLTNKTLTAPIITSPTITVGSDATGDMYYNGGAGVTTRLPAGTSGYVITSNGAGVRGDRAT